MNGKTFMAYSTISFTAILLLYAFGGSILWIGTVSIPVAGLVAGLAVIGLLALAAS